MTSRDTLRKNRRRRIIMYGTKGTGKTSGLVTIARDYAQHGKVLFLDTGSEQGAVDDLLQLDEATLSNIDYHQPRSFKQLVELLTPGYGLVVVDALQNLRSIAAEVSTAALIAAGADKDDGKDTGKGVLGRLMAKDGVGHPGVLPYGKGTSLMKAYESTFFDRLWDMGCDVVCAVNTKSLGASENYVEALGGQFDVVVETDRVKLPSGKYEYVFTVDKVRGVEFTNGSAHQVTRGENILVRVDELTQPAPPKKYRCETCGKTEEMSALRACVSGDHIIKPAV